MKKHKIKRHGRFWGVKYIVLLPSSLNWSFKSGIRAWGFFIDTSSVQFFKPWACVTMVTQGYWINVLPAIIVSYLCTNSWTAFFNFKCDQYKFKLCHEEHHRMLQRRRKMKIYANKILLIHENIPINLSPCAISFSTSTSAHALLL